MQPQPIEGNFTLSATKESRRISIDRDIEAHLAAILTLKSQRNELAPVGQLPVEILAKVFEFVKIAETQPPVNVPKANAKLQWIKVSHVSAHWRNVAIRAPSLWGDPPMEKRRWSEGHWVEVMLERSRMADLFIEATLEEYPRMRVVEELQQCFRHYSRIRHLAIKNLQHQTQAMLDDLPTSVPRLETLRIIGEHPPPMVATRFGEDSGAEEIYLPTHVLTDASNLRQLELSNCRVNWDSHLFSRITHLKLHDIARSSRQSMQFRDALGKMTRLESLDLQNALPVYIDAYPSYHMHFACLQKLAISSIIQEVEAFFYWITFPLTTKVQIIGMITLVNNSNNFHLSGFLSSTTSSYSTSISDLKFRTLVVDNLADSPRIRLFMEDLDIKDEISACPAVAHWSLEVRSARTYMIPTNASIIMDTVRSGIFSLEEVDHVHLGIDVGSKTLADTVGQLPAVSFIRVIGCCMANSLVVALWDEGKLQDPGSIPRRFANLALVYLDGVVFTKKQPTEEFRRDLPVDFTRFGALKVSLALHAKRGGKIKKLTLRGCSFVGIDKADVRSLRNVVEDVRWETFDGKDLTYDESEDEESESDDEERYRWDSDGSDYTDADDHGDEGDEYSDDSDDFSAEEEYRFSARV